MKLKRTETGFRHHFPPISIIWICVSRNIRRSQNPKAESRMFTRPLRFEVGLNHSNSIVPEYRLSITTLYLIMLYLFYVCLLTYAFLYKCVVASLF